MTRITDEAPSLDLILISEQAGVGPSAAKLPHHRPTRAASYSSQQLAEIGIEQAVVGVGLPPVFGEQLEPGTEGLLNLRRGSGTASG